MSNENRTGFWWLQMPYKFFDMHEFLYIRSLENGNIKVHIFTEMIVESVKYNGHMRFSDDIPYTPSLLAPIVHTTEEILAGALKDFEKVGLIQILDDLTIYIPMVASMVGFQTKEAARKMKQRRNENTDSGQVTDNSGQMSQACPKVVAHSNSHSQSHSQNNSQKTDLTDLTIVFDARLLSYSESKQTFLKRAESLIIEKIARQLNKQKISNLDAYMKSVMDETIEKKYSGYQERIRTYTDEEIELANFDWISSLGDE